MRKFKETTKQFVKTFVANMVERDAREWPPTCLLFAYQPERPCNHTNNNQTEHAQEHLTGERE